MTKSRFPSNTASKAATSNPVLAVRSEIIPLHQITLRCKQSEALDRLNSWYHSSMTDEVNEMNTFQEKEDNALFFLDMAVMIRFVYANFSE